MGSHKPAVGMIGHSSILLSLVAAAAAQLCSTVQDPIKRDEGSGPWNVSRVERSGNGRNGRLVPIGDNHPLPNAFYEGDSYVMQYSVRKGKTGCNLLLARIKEQQVGKRSKCNLNGGFGQ